MTIAARDRLIVALDVPSVAQAEALVAKLGESASFYKIGYQLAYAGGIDFARVLASAGKQVFLDLKLHDIGNTVAKGVESVARLGATFLTVHAYPQTMHAAVDARAGSNLRILAVTVLTSYDDADLGRVDLAVTMQADPTLRWLIFQSLCDGRIYDVLLAESLNAALRRLADLDVARWRPEVATLREDLDGPTQEVLPPDFPDRGSRLLARAQPAVTMQRFRPNLVLAGLTAHLHGRFREPQHAGRTDRVR